MPKRQRKKYSKPRKLYDSVRIKEENVLVEKYGLKNKREIWKAEASIKRIRNLAKKLITAGENEKINFVERLKKKGFKINNISDALALNKEDLLKRRLQTVLFVKGLANTSKQARQLIVHKHVSIEDQTVNIPSYHVNLEEEPLVKLNISLKFKKDSEKENIIEEIKNLENLEEIEQNATGTTN